MKYLYIRDEGASFSQTNTEPSQDDLQAVYEGLQELLTFEEKRGFCKAVVNLNKAEGEEEEDEYSVDDWQRVDVE